MNGSRTGRGLFDKLGKTMAITGALGIVGLAASFTATTVLAHSGFVTVNETCAGWTASVSLDNNVTSDRTVDVLTTIPGTTGITGGHYSTTGNSGPVEIWDASGSTPETGTVTLEIWDGATLEFSAEAMITAPTGCPTTVTTSLSANSTPLTGSSPTVSAGTPVTDTVTLKGGTSNITGPITISVYTGLGPDVCTSDNWYTSLVAAPTTSGDGNYSATFDSLPPGNYEFQAQFAGNANNAPSTSTCGSEPLTICKSVPAVTTSLSAGEITVLDTVTDTASLTGATSDAGGWITISVYTGNGDEACDADAAFSQTVPVSGDGSYSATFGPLEIGSYELQAYYTGDGSNSAATSPCGSEPLRVCKTVPAITTSLSSGSITVLDTVTDTATLSGATSDATGSITINVFQGTGSAVCDDESPYATALAVPATDGDGGYSATFGPLPVGSYEFQARYAGDGNNSPATSPCGSEPLRVCKTSPAISTMLSNTSILAGGSVTDTATLAGASSDADGTIIIRVFSGDSCDGEPLQSETATPPTDGNGAYSATFTLPNVGAYEFQASFAGDTNDYPAWSSCGSEPLTVTPDDPMLTTHLASSTIAPGGSVTDTATFSDASSTADGVITIDLYSGDGAAVCTGAPIDSLTATPVTDGDGSYSVTFTSLTAGSYEAQASFAGDSNDNVAVSACGSEPLTVSSPAGGVLAASTTTPITGADLFGPGLIGAIAMLLGGMLLVAGRRVLRIKAR